MNYVALVNKENKIKENYYKFVNFIDFKSFNDNNIKVEEKTYESYCKLKDFLFDRNIDIYVDTAYRNFDEQKNIYKQYLNDYGESYCDNYVAPSGFSEHHTGLAIDIVIKNDNEYIYENNKLFENEDKFLEIHKYLSEFGFILRYPKGKENITGYSYEPWHIRYVGKVVANIIYKNNWTLEEYLTNFNGIIVVNKEKGCTSFDVVNEISHIFGIKRVGHTGTLDPMASGVLVVAIGKATKICELLTSTYKEYIASVLLGIKTDTLDITGNVIDKKDYVYKDIKSILKLFEKTYLQEVPIYSAVKVNGKKLYEYARENKEVVLPKKEVTIKKINLLEENHNDFTFECLVSKGCYIRSLINDIGNCLDTFATMSSLIRIKQGKFSIENSYLIDDILNNNYKLFSIEEALNYPIINLSGDLLKKVSNGSIIENQFNISDKVIFKDNDKIIGIYEAYDNILKTWKNFN